MKSLMVFLFALAALASVAFTIPTPDLIDREVQTIHVTSPAAGPWKVGSQQSVSWWSTDIPTYENAVIEIYDTNGNTVFSGTKSMGTGTIQFTIDNSWDTSAHFYAFVYLESDKNTAGKSGLFTITN